MLVSGGLEVGGGERSGAYLCELHFGLGIVNWGACLFICSCSRGCWCSHGDA